MRSLEETFLAVNETTHLPDLENLACFFQEGRRTRRLTFAEQLHVHVCNIGLDAQPCLGNHLTALFVDCGSLRHAEQVFNRSVEQNEYAWSSLVKGYAECGELWLALSLYYKMQDFCVYSIKNTVVVLLKACSKQNCIECGLDLHTHILKKGLQGDAFIGNALVEMYAKCGFIMEAQKVFDGVSVRDVVSWTVLMAGFLENKLGEEALHCFEQMQMEGVSPDAVTYIYSLKACGTMGAIEKGQEIRYEIFDRGYETDPYVGSALVDMYAKCGFLAEAQEVFNDLPVHDVVSWTALIEGYTEHGFGKEALNCFKQMQVHGVVPNAVTLGCVLQACSSIGAIEEGQEIHALFVKQGMERDYTVGNMLVDMYAKFGLLLEAQKVFDSLPVKDVVSWTALIAGYAEGQHYYEVSNSLEQMQSEGVSPNAITYISSLKAWSSMGTLDRGQEMHAEIVKRGFDKEPQTGNILVDVYAKCGCFAEALNVFSKLPVRGVVSWNTLVASYTEYGLYKDALDCLQLMLSQAVSPDDVTFLCCLMACASIGAVDKGREIHARVANQSFGQNLFIGNALIDMYSKCNSAAEAQRVFNALSVKDKVSWNALIAGYAGQGCNEEALNCLNQMQLEGILVTTVSWNILILASSENGETERAFNLHAQMQEQGLLPDGVSFMGVLLACTNSTAIEVGKKVHAQILGISGDQFFDMIMENALIDMYGKCGNMPAAQQVFESMRTRVLFTWNALIAGYAHHGAVEHVLYWFKEMKAERIQPDAVTFLSVLTVCSHRGQIDLGQKFFEAMNKEYDISVTIKHYSCMIDLLGRSGQLDLAVAMVNNLDVKPNLVTWLSLLAACQKQGDMEVGRRVFECALKLYENSDALYAMMSNIFSDADIWEDAKDSKVVGAYMQE